MKRITFLGELAQRTGYGQHSAVAIKALQEAGFYVSIRPLRVQPGTHCDLAKLFVHCPQPEDWEIMISPPHRDVTPGKRTIYWTMWESTRLPKKSIEILNRCEHVVVPSLWNKISFKESGVTVPISIIPLGVDPEVFSERPAPQECVFAAAGNLSNGAKRKGVHEAIEAFQMAFPKNTRAKMRVKVTGKMEIKDERIEVIDRPMEDLELSQWYGRSSVFVSCAKAEGWGLMQLQAMATGRPVIAPAYGGLAEFLDETVGYPVFYKETDAEEIWTGLGKWAKPQLDHVAMIMRSIYENPKEAAELGTKALERAKQFSWKASMDAFVALVQKCLLS